MALVNDIIKTLVLGYVGIASQCHVNVIDIDLFVGFGADSIDNFVCQIVATLREAKYANGWNKVHGCW